MAVEQTHLLTHPRATLDDLMGFVPGPDLPGGGRIIGLDGIREAYETVAGPWYTRQPDQPKGILGRLCDSD